LKVGLFFGSFNPIHVGHLIIASHFVSQTDLQQVWFVVSPQNPFKKKETLLNEYDRLHLVELATKDNSKFRTSNIEFSLPKPSYTIDTLTHLNEKFPQHQFVLILGSDNIDSLPKWKNYEVLLNNYEVYCYQRGGEAAPNFSHKNIHIFSFPQMDISSTYIRKCVKEGHNIAYLVPKEVANYIEEMHLYK
jgi:nicotinate-nucleotide adenylyltransferase